MTAPLVTFLDQYQRSSPARVRSLRVAVPDVPATASRARTAYPSIALLSHGGIALGATTSAAAMRSSPSIRPTDSTPAGTTVPSTMSRAGPISIIGGS